MSVGEDMSLRVWNIQEKNGNFFLRGHTHYISQILIISLHKLFFWLF